MRHESCNQPKPMATSWIILLPLNDLDRPAYSHFQPSGLLNPITFIDGAGKQYVIEGEVGGTAIYYIPNPTDKVTGTLRTSSLLYTFFGSMTGPSSD